MKYNTTVPVRRKKKNSRFLRGFDSEKRNTSTSSSSSSSSVVVFVVDRDAQKAGVSERLHREVHRRMAFKIPLRPPMPFFFRRIARSLARPRLSFFRKNLNRSPINGPCDRERPAGRRLFSLLILSTPRRLNFYSELISSAARKRERCFFVFFKYRNFIITSKLTGRYGGYASPSPNDASYVDI